MQDFGQLRAAVSRTGWQANGARGGDAQFPDFASRPAICNHAVHRCAGPGDTRFAPTDDARRGLNDQWRDDDVWNGLGVDVGCRVIDSLVLMTVTSERRDDTTVKDPRLVVGSQNDDIARPGKAPYS
jgi:hypothetical protein